MKKLFILIIIFFISYSFYLYYNEITVVYNGITDVNYTIEYEDTTITYDSIFYFEYIKMTNFDQRVPYISNYNEQKYIHLGINDVINTIYPIKINSYRIIK